MEAPLLINNYTTISGPYHITCQDQLLKSDHVKRQTRTIRGQRIYHVKKIHVIRVIILTAFTQHFKNTHR